MYWAQLASFKVNQAHCQQLQVGEQQYVNLGYFEIRNHLVTWEKQLVGNVSAFNAASTAVAFVGSPIQDGPCWYSYDEN